MTVDWCITESTAGVDEAGRGPLAGPVVAAAVILDSSRPIDGLRDSKKLTASARARLYLEIMEKAHAVGVGRAETYEIDSINILQATFLAMQRALAALSVFPEQVLVDGHLCPVWSGSIQAIVRGDDLVPAISAASIIAKVTRDREMEAMDVLYPGYGFAKHKGYGTKVHLAAIESLGACPIHRMSFAPLCVKDRPGNA